MKVGVLTPAAKKVIAQRDSLQAELTTLRAEVEELANALKRYVVESEFRTVTSETGELIVLAHNLIAKHTPNAAKGGV